MDKWYCLDLYILCLGLFKCLNKNIIFVPAAGDQLLTHTARAKPGVEAMPPPGAAGYQYIIFNDNRLY